MLSPPKNFTLEESCKSQWLHRLHLITPTLQFSCFMQRRRLPPDDAPHTVHESRKIFWEITEECVMNHHCHLAIVIKKIHVVRCNFGISLAQSGAGCSGSFFWPLRGSTSNRHLDLGTTSLAEVPHVKSIWACMIYVTGYASLSLYVMQHIKRETLQVKSSFSFDVLELFLILKMTPYLSKLFKAFTFYNWKKDQKFCLFSLLFSECLHLYLSSRKLQSPPFDVLYHIWVTILTWS